MLETIQGRALDLALQAIEMLKAGIIKPDTEVRNVA